MKKRIIPIMLAAALAMTSVLSLFACSHSHGDETASGTNALAAASETVTDVVTEDTVGAVIASPESSQFRIIYAKDAPDAVREAALYLAKQLGEAFGTAPETADDSTAASGYELLVGKTNRAPSPLASDAPERAFCVHVSDKTVSLDAVRDDFVVRAVDHLLDAYVGDDASVLGLKMITDYTDLGETYQRALHFSVDGEPAYTVVYDPADGDDAAFTAQWFSRTYSARGYALNLSDAPVDGACVRLDIDAGLATDWSASFDDKGSITVSGKDRDALSWGLTVLSGARLTPDRYGEILITDTSDMSGDMSACTREGWGLPVPAYEGGKLSENVYNCGAGNENDSKALVSSQTYMMCVSSTSREEYDAYVQKLESLGYVRDSGNTYENPRNENCYGQYICGTSTIYTYFLGAISEVRIIDDRASVPESIFEDDYEAAADEAGEVILYGLYMHPLGINSNEPGGDPNISNCGEFMMVRQPDNGLFLIDGGSSLQSTDAAVENAWNYMREITGTPETEKLRISCWYISHPHGDHYSIVNKLLEKHGDMMVVERIMFNFVNAGTTNLSISQAPRNAAIKYCKDALVMKCHPGQSIRLGGVVYDVITTHEDLVNAGKGVSTAAEVNSTSTVLRVTMPDGQRAMILGDATNAVESFVNRNLHRNELSCRMVQVAHHAWNRLTTIYKSIGAEYALWPQYEYTNFVEVNSHRTLAYDVAKVLTKSGAQYNYFSGLNTARVICRNGDVEVVLSDTVY